MPRSNEQLAVDNESARFEFTGAFRYTNQAPISPFAGSHTLTTPVAPANQVVVSQETRPAPSASKSAPLEKVIVETQQKPAIVVIETEFDSLVSTTASLPTTASTLPALQNTNDQLAAPNTTPKQASVLTPITEPVSPTPQTSQRIATNTDPSIRHHSEPASRTETAPPLRSTNMDPSKAVETSIEPAASTAVIASAPPQIIADPTSHATNKEDLLQGALVPAEAAPAKTINPSSFRENRSTLGVGSPIMQESMQSPAEPTKSVTPAEIAARQSKPEKTEPSKSVSLEVAHQTTASTTASETVVRESSAVRLVVTSIPKPARSEPKQEPLTSPPDTITPDAGTETATIETSSIATAALRTSPPLPTANQRTGSHQINAPQHSKYTRRSRRSSRSIRSRKSVVTTRKATKSSSANPSTTIYNGPAWAGSAFRTSN
jgi:hypothetical protein